MLENSHMNFLVVVRWQVALADSRFDIGRYLFNYSILLMRYDPADIQSTERKTSDPPGFEPLRSRLGLERQLSNLNKKKCSQHYEIFHSVENFWAIMNFSFDALKFIVTT